MTEWQSSEGKRSAVTFSRSEYCIILSNVNVRDFEWEGKERKEEEKERSAERTESGTERNGREQNERNLKRFDTALHGPAGPV